ncbi:hypothetical protein AQUCO_00400604v1 [Aquilegia coerulea]|uniref:HRDC domain-containing protein n=1 Tax=Aquilegia coerulea TaxID=218851 RepID=A0A2G5EVS9_AQUCA|nr:hypothetical protein AQUCO_00400604v1 [Aquilegia coerulea]
MMEIDSDSEQSSITKKKIETLASSPLTSSISKLSISSRGIPSDEDFHFYYNFNEFKNPIKEIVKKTESTLKSIGSSTSSIWDKNFNFPDDLDDAYDWLVNINDELFERFDSCVDEFKQVRKMEEESGKRVINSIMDEDGFQLVGRKKKGGSRNLEKDEGEKFGSSSSSVKTVLRDKRTTGARPRVPFHIPSITRPQREFKMVVDNSNEPFEHVWLEKSEDGNRVIHPLENYTDLDFIDRHTMDVELVKPLPLESTPFKLVEEVKDLKELAAKLHDVNEFAVDLEHNQYRSFQGLTCLMQISTRFEDFVVDTLKLHAHIGPHLREVFKDPSKKKVMHGANQDMLWLQRDFGIYVCNMFDTGQASRVLNLERNSLEYLLHHYCGVTANKEYQNADWRLRPIPAEMLKYAREDTHYLLHIYDLMKVSLREASAGSENVDALLSEVYKRSYDVCMQLYEKEIRTDTSYLYIYGVQGAEFNSQQLAVVAGLCEWRDGVARAEDESTGFILPNKALVEIARHMPLTAGKLRRLVSSKHSYVERNLGSVVNIIKRSIENASAYESVAEQLQNARTEMALAKSPVVADESEALANVDYPTEGETVSVSPQENISGESTDGVITKKAKCTTTSLYVKEEPLVVASSTVECGTCGPKSVLDLSDEVGQLKKEQNGNPVELSQEKFVPGQVGAQAMKESDLQSTNTVNTEATVRVLKKPNRAFGALLGNSASKRKLNADPKVEIKVEQIKSSVTLPFHSFCGGSGQSEPFSRESTSSSYVHSRELNSVTTDIANVEDIISLENCTNVQDSLDAVTDANDSLEHRETDGKIGLSDTGDNPISLSELSSSFQDCLQSINEKRNNGRVKKPREPESSFQLKPFDYAAAREEMRFGKRQEDNKETTNEESHKNLLHSKERRKNSVSSRVPRDDGNKDFQPARRRMAFPPTGNRSATFR